MGLKNDNLNKLSFDYYKVSIHVINYNDYERLN